MNQVQHLKSQGLESFGINVIKNSCNFASKANRFEYKDLREKSMLPGPGAYAHEGNNQKKNGNVQSLSQGRFNEKLNPSMLKVTNPPSIPSHLSVFGYEENQHG